MTQYDKDLERLSDEAWCAKYEPSGVVAAWVGVFIFSVIGLYGLIQIYLLSWE